MGTGIDISKISYTDPRFKLYNNLQSDAARFATFREAQKQRELSAVRTDLDKSRIEKRYAEYLKTEKQGIFANAAAAERWTGFQENADLYPNLEWRTAGDSDVRPEHARLDGLILPINDPFWNSHTPPLGFGCRCEVIQTDEKVNKTEGHENTPAPKGFDFNPGVDQKIFSDSAGYYTSAPRADVGELTKVGVTQLKIRLNELVLSEVRGKTLAYKGKEIAINRVGIDKTRSFNKDNATALTAMLNPKNLQDMIDTGKHRVEEYRKIDKAKMEANTGIAKYHVWEGKGFILKAKEDTTGALYFYLLKFL